MLAIPDAICWHEGMHLLPQHFQLQSLRAECLSARLAENGNPWFWGVQYIESQVLVSGEIIVTALNAVMPDGLVIDLDADKDKERFPLSLKLTENDFHGNDPVMVYLAIDPLWRSDRLVDLNGRLRSIRIEALDLTDSTNPVTETVTAWRPTLRLVTYSGLSNSIHLPLFRISNRGGTYGRLDYEPPCPIVTTDSSIGKRIDDACQLALSKCDFLMGRWRRARDTGKLHESAEFRTQLIAIGTRLPELQAALSTGASSPATLHRLLAGLAGAIYGLDPQSGVPVFAPLKFDDLLSGFNEVLSWIEGQLHNIRAVYSRRTFEYKDKHFFIALTDRQTPRQQLGIGLRMPIGATPQAAQDWLTSSIRASRPHLPDLIRQRGHGLSFSVLRRNDQVAYGASEDTRLFHLHAAGENFSPDSDLCLFMPAGGGRVEPIEIFIFDTSTLD